MGKDFTPRELHDADIALGLHKNNLRIVDMSGKEIKFAGDSYKEEFPNMAFLAGEVLEDLIMKFGTDDPILKETEKTLGYVIDAHDEGISFEECYANYPYCGGKELVDMLEKWYEGKLDPHFYYRETNDVLLKDYLVSKIESWREKEELVTFYVPVKVVGIYEAEVLAKKGDIEDAKQKALIACRHADFGELEVEERRGIKGKPIIVESDDGYNLYER